MIKNGEKEKISRSKTQYYQILDETQEVET